MFKSVALICHYICCCHCISLNFISCIIQKVLSAILSSKNLLRLRSSNAYLILITSLVAADGAASGLLGVIIILLRRFPLYLKKKTCAQFSRIVEIWRQLRYVAGGFGYKFMWTFWELCLLINFGCIFVSNCVEK